MLSGTSTTSTPRKTKTSTYGATRPWRTGRRAPTKTSSVFIVYQYFAKSRRAPAQAVVQRVGRLGAARGFFAGTGEDPLGTGGARDDDPRWSVGVVGDRGGRRGRAGTRGHRRKRREVGIVDRLADAFRREGRARATTRVASSAGARGNPLRLRTDETPRGPDRSGRSEVRGGDGDGVPTSSTGTSSRARSPRKRVARRFTTARFAPRSLAAPPPFALHASPRSTTTATGPNATFGRLRALAREARRNRSRRAWRAREGDLRVQPAGALHVHHRARRAL